MRVAEACAEASRRRLVEGDFGALSSRNRDRSSYSLSKDDLSLGNTTQSVL